MPLPTGNHYPLHQNHRTHMRTELTDENLKNYGFTQLPHFTVQNLWKLDIGRNRVITIAYKGTPNEMVFISEEKNNKVEGLVILRNYDYDGYTYMEDINNIVLSITKHRI